MKLRELLVSVPEIKSLFVHPFLAERIISMLNYFLQHLVGPKMGALKVKDFSEFDFKPQQLVSDICTIYLNLGYVTRECWRWDVRSARGEEWPLGAFKYKQVFVICWTLMMFARNWKWNLA